MAQVKSQLLIEKVDSLVNIAVENQGLINYLKGCDDWKDRWEILEEYISKRLADSGSTFNNLNWDMDIRNQFFYKVQQRTKMDFGFCPKFRPAYAERLKYYLDGETNPEYNMDLCNLNGTTIPTTCNGLDRDRCVHYRKRIKH